ncbi:signal recognition particle 54 kDa protein, chloroplastic-like [Hibiscus syriacus]|uniref:signal recognition particle 54 kDa protein, chloroplastic-like n=1 Tax=Hibiscus syriacus TaxID=106335 RepID=UPI001923D2A0|nr:signal recognition particle 54 kDa protein, chloroplastic-like [Hibiscus syriacus]
MGDLDKLIALQILLESYGICEVAQTDRLDLRLMNDTNVIAEFYQSTRVILTKLDGGSRDGATLSNNEVFRKPIKLVDHREYMEDLKQFYLDRTVGYLLKIGYVLSLVEKAQGVMCQEYVEDLQKKLRNAYFDFNDFQRQTRAVARMCFLTRINGIVPDIGIVTPTQFREADEKFKLLESMIKAMSPYSSTSYFTVFAGNKISLISPTNLEDKVLFKRGYCYDPKATYVKVTYTTTMAKSAARDG